MCDKCRDTYWEWMRELNRFAKDDKAEQNAKDTYLVTVKECKETK